MKPPPAMLGDALAGLKHRRKQVVGDQLRSAEAQHVGVDATPYQVGAQFVGAPGSIWKRLHVIGGDQLASGIDGES